MIAVQPSTPPGRRARPGMLGKCGTTGGCYAIRAQTSSFRPRTMVRVTAWALLMSSRP